MIFYHPEWNNIILLRKNASQNTFYFENQCGIFGIHSIGGILALGYELIGEL